MRLDRTGGCPVLQNVLPYSRDPFRCSTTSQGLQTFFDCHRRAIAHFGGGV
ncbi:hypothetical protein ACFV16_38115 [Streptomyces massasporeus]|uniref:hypothetical protein n=1 Tax=Streptomyces massasporeus TaxID=67324 RepID=UPI0036846DFB